MKKRKPASKAKKKSPLLKYDANNLHSHMFSYRGRVEPSRAGEPLYSERPAVGGIELPENLSEVAMEIAISDAVIFDDDWKFVPPKMLTGNLEWLHETIADAVKKGFALALLRYADELKSNPEAAALVAAARANSKKGIAAIKRKSELKKREARRLDRELRKTIKKRNGRETRIAEIMKVGTRQVWNYIHKKD